MKISLLSLLAFPLLLFPTGARADHHEVFIHQVISLNSSSCAVALEIEAPNQDGFEGVDRIEINGSLLAMLGDTEAADINTGGHVNTGDMILFASNTFSADTHLTADANFADSQCPNFTAGATFDFVIDDPLFGGPNAVIDSLTTPQGFGINIAAVKSSESSAPALVDLVTDNVTVENNTGASVTIGDTSGGGGGSGGGCLLGEAMIPESGRGLAVFGWTLLSLASFRRVVRRR